MINKQTLIILVSLIFSLSAFSQISEGGTPPSFSHAIARSASSIFQVPVNLDISRLTWEDEMVERNDGPMRVAEVLPVNININTTGNWVTLSDSVKVWQQTIVAEGAKGLILSYNDFYIPEGAKLYIYNEDHSQVLGAYTKNTHPKGGKFASEAILGDKITLEYVASKTSNESPRIEVKDVGYIYNDKAMLRITFPTPEINKSDACMINVNCPQGDNWQNQKRGVVMYMVKFTNWYACSGSLVNNTRRDGAPYLLTAFHCFIKENEFEGPDYETVISYFNYEFPGCENEDIFPVTTKTLVGTDLLVKVPITETTDGVTTKGSDGALLKLKNDVPLEWKPFYNGWDRNDTPASSGVVIHHPNKDVKKITTYVKPLRSATYNGDYIGAANAHWEVQYDGNSVTQGGSSGSPIFNQNGLIVGTLTGGATFCTSKLASDYFGKMSYHWDYLADESRQMKKYLDPINEGTLFLKGYDPNNPLGIEDTTVINTPKELIIFPTLADTEVNVNTNSIIRTIIVYDMSGRKLYTKSGYNASTAIIPVDSWAKGVYSILVHTESKKLTGKFIKK